MRGFTNMKGLIAGTKLSKWLCASAAAVAFATPVVTQAAPGPWRDDDGHGEWHDRYHRDDHDGLRFDLRIGDRPRVVDREVRVWVPAVYRTECEHVWVPDVYEDRVVRWFAKGEWHTRLRSVLVTPGHYEDRNRQVLVSEGHYETRIERVKVDDGDAGFRLRSEVVKR